jgi:hypothetical protein
MESVKDAIGELRETLSERFNRAAGAKLIAYFLGQASSVGRELPSLSSIYKTLVEGGYIRVRPKTKHTPLVLPAPNEEWELDFGEIYLGQSRVAWSSCWWWTKAPRGWCTSKAQPATARRVPLMQYYDCSKRTACPSGCASTATRACGGAGRATATRRRSCVYCTRWASNPLCVHTRAGYKVHQRSIFVCSCRSPVHMMKSTQNRKSYNGLGGIRR